MPISKKNSSFAIAAVIAVLGIVVYMVWLRPDADPNVTIIGNTVANEAQATFLTLAAQLEPVAFDASVLDDPRFNALIDIGTVILPEPEGRTDPFGPLSGVAASAE